MILKSDVDSVNSMKKEIETKINHQIKESEKLVEGVKKAYEDANLLVPEVERTKENQLFQNIMDERLNKGPAKIESIEKDFSSVE